MKLKNFPSFHVFTGFILEIAKMDKYLSKNEL